MTQYAKPIGLQGQENCRDLGGLTNQYGLSIRQQKLFRSGQLHTVSDADLQDLAGKNVSQTIDFRSTEESSSQANRSIATVTSALHLPIQAGNLSPSQVGDLLLNAQANEIEQFFLQLYQDLVINAQQQYQAFFTALLENQDGASLYHCTAGKDRTGFATALLLSALSVDNDTVFNDYLASNQYQNHTQKAILQFFPNPTIEQKTVIDALLLVKPSYLQQSFAMIDQQYQSMDCYLNDVLNVDCQSLRAAFLE